MFNVRGANSSECTDIDNGSVRKTKYENYYYFNEGSPLFSDI